MDQYLLNEHFLEEWGTTWDAITKETVITNFVTQELVVTGQTLVDAMFGAANMAIQEYTLLHENCNNFWSFDDSFFFAGTLASTIGYGNIAPRSLTGKMFCMVFCAMGIPYFAYMLSVVSEGKFANQIFVIYFHT